jgi:hypothetical protein
MTLWRAARLTITPRTRSSQAMIAEARPELFEIREGIFRLMDRFHGR